MANTDKNIVITPATGTAGLPTIEFTGNNNNSTVLSVQDDNTITFANSLGTLLTINPDFDGTFYAVSDGGGVPFIEAANNNSITIGGAAGLTTLIGTSTNNNPSYRLQIGGDSISSGTIQATRFISTQGPGIAPFSVTSSTLVSNLNADLLDGVQGSQFVRSDTADTMTGMLTINHAGDEIMRLQDTSSTGSPYLTFYQNTTRAAYIQYVNGTGLRLLNDVTDDYLDIQSGINGLKYYGDSGPHTVWHAGNDGPGSGLDADTVDGLQVLDLQKALARTVGWVPSYNNADENSVYWDLAFAATRLYSASDTTIGMSYTPQRIGDGDTYEISITVWGSAAASSGLYLRIYEYNAELPSGKTHISNDATPSYVQEDTSGKSNWVENAAISTSRTTYTYSYTPTAGARYASVVLLNWTGIGTNVVYATEPRWRVVSNAADGGGGGGGVSEELAIAYAIAL